VDGARGTATDVPYSPLASPARHTLAGAIIGPSSKDRTCRGVRVGCGLPFGVRYGGRGHSTETVAGQSDREPVFDPVGVQRVDNYDAAGGGGDLTLFDEVVTGMLCRRAR